MKLVVTEAFADYAKGDEITDTDMIKTILDGDQAQLVVKVASQDPAPDSSVKAKK